MKKFGIYLLLLAMGVTVALTGCVNDTGDNATSTVADAPSDTEAQEPQDEPYVYEAEYTEYEYTEYEYVAPQEEYEAATEGQAIAVPAGFVEYVSARYGFSIHHPESWISSDALSSLVDDMAREALADSIGQEALDLLFSQDYGSTMAAIQWFDPTSVSGLFMANTNIVLSPASGLTQGLLQDDGIKEMFAAMYDEMFASVFDSFERTGDIYGEYIGNNYFTFYQSDIVMMGVESSFVQFFTVIGDYSYTITFAVPHGQADLDLAKSIVATLNA